MKVGSRLSVGPHKRKLRLPNQVDHTRGTTRSSWSADRSHEHAATVCIQECTCHQSTSDIGRENSQTSLALATANPVIHSNHSMQCKNQLWEQTTWKSTATTRNMLQHDGQTFPSTWNIFTISRGLHSTKKTEFIIITFVHSVAWCPVFWQIKIMMITQDCLLIKGGTTRECVHLVTCVHFQTCDEDSSYTIRSAIPENPMLHANITAACWQNGCYCQSKFYTEGIRIFYLFGTFPITFIYELEP